MAESRHGPSKPLRIGIVGTGQRCMYFFAPYIKAHPHRAQLVALADHDPARLHGAIAELGGTIRPYNSIEALLHDQHVDAVIITTPDATHRQILDNALDAGRHVLCEKPMATTIEDALHMARRALAAPQLVQIGFTLRSAPFFVQLQEIVRSNAIGTLRQISAVEVLEYYHGASFFRRWHRFCAQSGGLLVHKASHILDIINWLVDSVPDYVSAQGGTNSFVPNANAASSCHACALTATCPAAYRADRYNYTYQTRQEWAVAAPTAPDLCAFNSEKDSIDNAAVLAHYANGVGLTFAFATTGRRHTRHLLLLGERGQIRASQTDGVIVVEPLEDESYTVEFPEALRDEHGGGDARLMEEFLACVATGRRPVADVLAGLYSVALGVAATQSIAQGGDVIDLRPTLQSLSPAPARARDRSGCA